MNIAKENRAIQILRAFEPQDDERGYFLCYSGGKDSDTIRILAEIAGVRHECKHSLTTVDAPETVRYIRDTIGAENIIRPPLSMWQLIVKKGVPPTRIRRYCCSELKERGGKGQVKVTGVRRAESRSRELHKSLVTIIGSPKHTQQRATELGLEYRLSPKEGLLLDNCDSKTRLMVEQSYKKVSTMVNPIIDWTESDVWEFLHYHGCESNPLYKCGYKRIGCVGCPLNSKNQRLEFERYPKFREIYVKTFDRMLEERARLGKPINALWSDGEAVMRWWTGEIRKDGGRESP